MDGSYCVKPMKQKQVVNSPIFLLSSLPSSFCVGLLKDNIFISPWIFYAWPWRAAAFIILHGVCSQVDGVSYLLQEIYGIENKYNSQESKARWSKTCNIWSYKEKSLKAHVLLSAGCWRWDQWQQCGVCCVFVGRARHSHPAVQTPVSLQRLRRHAALPGQLLPHLQAAWVEYRDHSSLFLK